MTPRRNAARIAVKKVDATRAHSEHDVVAVEEPLEIRVSFQDASGAFVTTNLSVTMRTPGNDYELAAGFLFTEGILNSPEQLDEMTYCVGADKSQQQYNVLNVRLRPGVRLDLARLQRNFYTSSSCGVCGKASIEAVRTQCQQRLKAGVPAITNAALAAMPEKLRAAQDVFDKTGGLHAAGLFTPDGTLISVREDVGRHNAVDKVVGEQFLAGKLPLEQCALLVSGRASFELVQKTVMAGVPILAAVGAPSSLAVELARETGLTLIGFLRGDRFNIYSADERVKLINV